jgi:hypothetical protein
MTTNHILTDNDAVRIARRPITMTVAGGRPGEVKLVARPGETSGARTRGNPAIMVLSAIDGRTEIRLEPRPGELFPDGTIVSLELCTAAGSGEEQDVVNVLDVEVSGLPFRDLVVIDIVDDRSDTLLVSALDVVDDPAVTPLAEMARAAARAHLRQDGIADPMRVLVAVDMTLSMAPAMRDGSLEAALDVLVGLSQVIDSDRVPEVFLFAEQIERLPPAEILDLASTTADEVRRRGLGCGFRSTPAELRVDENTITFVLTDAAPADGAALRRAHEAGKLKHVVVICGAEETGTTVPTTQLPTGPSGKPIGDFLLDRYDQLAGFVASLLVSVERSAPVAA